MIIYKNTVSNFYEDVFKGVIANKLEELFIEHNIGKESRGEYRSWNNSLEVVSNTLQHANINKELNVAIEYQIPLTSRRVDFLISGLDKNDKETIVAMELKQWDKAEVTSLDNCVKAVVNGVNGVRPHPSQQILSYCQFITNFNVSVQDDDIKLMPCVFMHNYPNADKYILEDKAYEGIIHKAPLFYKGDREELGQYIKDKVLKPADRDLFEVIDNGKLRPSKALQDSILDLLDGKEEFTMIDQQQVAYATITKLVKDNVNKSDKYTIIVRGGPGTGKSVIAIQAMAKLISDGYAASYMTKNAAPRDVFKIKLTQGHKDKKYIENLFKSPISLEYCKKNDVYPCLIVDESHRLCKHYGHSQIDDIIRCSKINVFFIDEDQRVTTKDIGTVDLIKETANKYHSRIVDDPSLTLVSQFRCNGSDGYLQFLDNLLEIRETANTSLEGLDYDIRVFDSPTKMRDELKKINDINNKARLVAGYCYEWVSELSPRAYDIWLEDGFMAQWNLRNGQPFAIADTSFEQVGCIHTCQGLEFDYVGVIVGKDLRYENGNVITDPTQLADSDKSSGIKRCKDKALADRLIRNTYKTLMSRGQKGCFVYCEDKELAKHIKEVISKGLA
ncbi:MAG: DUF2075 domain-containing protein [Bacilli bacterium]|nr:DUF2075 domain-containing protein [Bacilli bacterium]